jgi:hypothetical protein
VFIAAPVTTCWVWKQTPFGLKRVFICDLY